MSDDQISALQSGPETKPDTDSTIAVDTVDESRLPKIPEELSILPVRGFVVFPGTIIPLNIQRAASLKLLDETLPRTKVIGLLAQRDESKEDPGPDDLYHVGTAALVLRFVRQKDDHVLVIVQGLRRFKLRKIVATDPFIRAEIDLLKSIPPPQSKENEAAFRMGVLLIEPGLQVFQLLAARRQQRISDASTDRCRDDTAAGIRVVIVEGEQFAGVW